MTQVMNKIHPYQTAFARLEIERLGHEPGWLHQIRKEAMTRFEEMGFPTTRDEEWRHTNISPITQQEFHPLPQGAATPSQLVSYLIPDLDAYTAIFVNGRFDANLSRLTGLPDGVRLESIAATLQTEPALLEPYIARQGLLDKHPFAALNTAFLSDGAFLYIPQEAVLNKPIHILYYSTPDGAGLSYPRTLLVAGKASQATVIESYAGDSGSLYFSNAVTEVIAAPGANIEHAKIQRESNQAFHVSLTDLYLDRDCQYRHHSITFGGRLVRNDINILLDNQGINCVLNGLYMTDGDRLVDNHTEINHAKPHCESHELYKGILDGKSQGVFKGKIYVAKDAQKTDAKQTNKALLLSEEAEIDSMPQLEIYADDVKCTHGSTTGHLDEEALFYLRARGVDLVSARSLLTYAFASEIVEQIGIEAVRNQLDQLLHERLSMD